MVRYVEYPWITCFEVEGIEIKKKAGGAAEERPECPGDI